MRIRLAPAPRRVLRDSEPARALEASESWSNWVAIKAPRESPTRPPERPETRLTPHWQGHAIPKPYQPPDES